MHDKGFAHGRFQILHNDHMKYILAAKHRCRHLIIGITNPEPSLTEFDETDPKRSAPEANPLSYEERKDMLHGALAEAGVEPGEYSLSPFPINFPELYEKYLSSDVVCFLTIYDEWGEKKLGMFESQGFQTEILWQKSISEKGIISSDIRNAIKNGYPWEYLVPESVAISMKKNDAIKRIRKS